MKDKLSELPHLYRFRSLERILDKKELENQEIYFAPFGQLNDPMEGFLNLFWKGDKVVWKNLFKNYLITLEHVILCNSIFDTDTKITDDHIQVFLNPDQLPTTIYKEKISCIFSSFFSHSSIKSLIDFLGNRKYKTQRSELQFYLELIHLFAFEMISISNQKYIKTPLSKLMSSNKLKKILNENFFYILKQMEEKPELKKFPEIFNILLDHKKQMTLIAIYQNLNDIYEKKNNRFVLFDFPKKYLDKLETLIFQSWHTACFTTSCKNMTMWKNYSSNHTGICLKFKTQNQNNSIGMVLENCITSYSLCKGKKTKKNRGERFLPFEKIKYQNKYPEIDFFKSLGRLPWPVLEKHWFLDESNRSPIIDSMRKNEESWRNNYQNLFYKSYTIKLPEWAYENECRLVLTNCLDDLLDENDRTLKYKFSSLEGIIFGMKTPIEAQVKIMKIISDKCKQYKKTDFKFYQTRYDSITGMIEIPEMELLKI